MNIQEWSIGNAVCGVLFVVLVAFSTLFFDEKIGMLISFFIVINLLFLIIHIETKSNFKRRKKE